RSNSRTGPGGRVTPLRRLTNQLVPRAPRRRRARCRDRATPGRARRVRGCPVRAPRGLAWAPPRRGRAATPAWGPALPAAARTPAAAPPAATPAAAPPEAAVPDGGDREITATPGTPAGADPVFVLCTSRSGSTLLRFVLDAHPDLACPPEMKLPFVLAQLARLWSATDGLGRESANGGPAISEAAAAGIRQTMDQMIGPYLARRGKTRYCDKNLGTEPHVETLLAVYPEAKFICLYRHPMDMIASGVEACPWGLSQYGFEPYVAHAPGNSVLALARYWSDHISAILAVEDKFPGRCHRVRYEDLVADPETVASGIFQFLGLPPAPGI